MDTRTREAIDTMQGLVTQAKALNDKAGFIKSNIIKEAMDILKTLGLNEDEAHTQVTKHFNPPINYTTT